MKTEKQSTELPNHIQAYFDKRDQTEKNISSKQLFNATKEDIDLKTDLKKEEIQVINNMLFVSGLIESKGLRSPFDNYLTKYMRLNVSLDRKSRGEFVNINKANNDLGEEADKLSNLKSLFGR